MFPQISGSLAPRIKTVFAVQHRVRRHGRRKEREARSAVAIATGPRRALPILRLDTAASSRLNTRVHLDLRNEPPTFSASHALQPRDCETSRAIRHRRHPPAKDLSERNLSSTTALNNGELEHLASWRRRRSHQITATLQENTFLFVPLSFQCQ